MSRYRHNTWSAEDVTTEISGGSKTTVNMASRSKSVQDLSHVRPVRETNKARKNDDEPTTSKVKKDPVILYPAADKKAPTGPPAPGDLPKDTPDALARGDDDSPILGPPKALPVRQTRFPAKVVQPETREAPPPKLTGKEGWDGETGGALKKKKKPTKWKRVPQRPAKKFTVWGSIVEYYLVTYANAIRWSLYIAIAVLWVYLLIVYRQKIAGVDVGNIDEKYHGVVPRDVRMDANFAEFEIDNMLARKDSVKLNLKIWGGFVTKEDQDSNYKTDEMDNDPTRRARILHLQVAQRVGAKVILNEAAGLRLVMKADDVLHERTEQDYTQFPRELTFNYQVPPAEKDFVKNKKRRSYLRFGVKEGSFSAVSIPFSFEYTLDWLTTEKRVKEGIIPIIIVAAFNAVEVNRLIAGMFGLCGLFRGMKEIESDMTMQYFMTLLDYDWIMYVIAIILFYQLLAESNVFAYLSYLWIKFIGFNFWAAILFLNIITSAGCYYFNNCFVSLGVLYLATRMMELMGNNPVPVIINILTVANIYGRGYVGTYESKFLLNHKQANSTPDASKHLTAQNLKKYAMWPALTVGLTVQLVWFMVYFFLRVQHFKRMRQIEENEHLMRLIDIIQLHIPDFSKNWHRVSSKMRAAKSYFAYEIREFRSRYRQFGPEPPKPAGVRLLEMYPECRLTNVYILLKMTIIGVFFVCCTLLYMYDFKGTAIFKKLPLQAQSYNTIEEFRRLGLMSIFIIILLLLMVHSRSLDMIAKKIDWEAVFYFAALCAIVKQISHPDTQIDHWLWSTYGKPAKGSKKKRVNIVMIQICTFGAMAGLFSDHVVFMAILDTAYKYSIYSHYDSFDIILTGFHFSVGLWGIATPVGSAVNIIGIGWACMNGYHNELTMFHYMRYGLPLAILSNFILYLYMYFFRIKLIND